MLVLDNDAERVFLDKVLTRLGYEVISMKKGAVLSEQLLDHFPDVVFAATLGKNQKILTALAKIKEARGKPKVVFVRLEREAAPLNADQKKVVDGVLYSPIDPFKLLDTLAHVTQRDLQELRQLYNEMLQKERGLEVEPTIPTAPQKKTDYATSKDDSGVLIIDYTRREKYKEICKNLSKEKREIPEFDATKLRELQKKQSKSVSEDADVKANRKHFLKTLFTMDPKKKASE